MKFFRYRRPSLKTILGITKAKKQIKKDLDITALLKPFRWWPNQKRKIKRDIGYESEAGRLIRGGLPKPGGCLVILIATIFLTLVGSLHAADKSPYQILGGKPAAISSGSGSYYDGSGSFAGRSSPSGKSTSLYDSNGGFAGRVEAEKDSTKFYDSKGGFAGRTEKSGNETKFYDSKGSFSGRSTTSGNSTKFYDAKGAYAGRSETSGSTTKFYDATGKMVGSKTK